MFYDYRVLYVEIMFYRVKVAFALFDIDVQSFKEFTVVYQPSSHKEI